ncbi:uncharacterized protein LOC132925235 [Rhopalosiphum padi]|uniref:uncharacterized protein LOC132925235 n=1 Tax=Rhopalosiphum padi TaxID=40932 RepID=UPI00298EA9F4|nr:uncharacterized protein LOC132925235 [Rhopalosiphum padi]
MDPNFDLRKPAGISGQNACKDVASATAYYLGKGSADLEALIGEIISGDWLTEKDGVSYFYGLDIKNASAYLSYQGFDPKRLAVKIDGMRKYEDRRQFDIGLMVAISIERGNKVSKMHLGSTDNFKRTLGELIGLYDLKDKAGKDPNAITLSRVAASFPHMACTYMNIAMNPTSEVVGGVTFTPTHY